jgi:hypothetical protein
LTYLAARQLGYQLCSPVARGFFSSFASDALVSEAFCQLSPQMPWYLGLFVSYRLLGPFSLCIRSNSIFFAPNHEKIGMRLKIFAKKLARLK